ncbi:hypothetical protein ACOYW6_11740 [Parablastomonas sp. CN1-191]|uniref:hypothetical protein n=1 Tax=Parablastomonas sp. CN1-191 TaxID=3400908 RepID=UPI003BF8C5C3
MGTFTIVLLAAAAAATPAAPSVPALPGDTILTHAPDAASEALGRELAASGTLAALAPLQARAETEELVAAHPELTAAEQAQLRAVAARTAAAGTERLMAAIGHAYAMRLSRADLSALVAFERTAAAKRMRTAIPFTIAATMQAVGKLDFKADTLAAFCKDTGKLCT